MTKKILTLLGAAVVSASAFASDYTVTLANTVVSQYYFRGVKVNEGVNIQPALDVSFGDASIGVWSSHNVSGSGDFHEFDFYGTYNFAVSETVSIPVGFTYYYYPTADLGSGLFRGTYEAFVGVSTTLGGIEITPKAYYDFKLEALTLELNLGYSVPLKDFGTSLDFAGSVGYWDSSDFVRGADIDAKNYYYSVGVSLPFALTENASVTAGVAFADGFDGDVSGFDVDFAAGQIIYSLAISASF